MRVVALGRRWDANDPNTGRFDRPIALIEHLLLRDRQRTIDAAAREVQRAIDDGADLVCLPGSSVPAVNGRPPKTLLDLSKRATLVLETVSAVPGRGNGEDAAKGGAQRRAWVLQGGEVLRGPIPQLFVDRAGSAENLRKLVEEIENGTRRFPIHDRYEGLVLLCGEINAVYTVGGETATFTPDRWKCEGQEELAGIWDRLERVIVCNPTHTWMRPTAVEAKRRFLASKGAYLSPTNAYAASDHWSASNMAGVICEERQSERAPIVIGGADAKRAPDPSLAWRAAAVDLTPRRAATRASTAGEG